MATEGITVREGRSFPWPNGSKTRSEMIAAPSGE